MPRRRPPPTSACHRCRELDVCRLAHVVDEILASIEAAIRRDPGAALTEIQACRAALTVPRDPAP